MKREEFRKLIKECLCEMLNDSTFDSFLVSEGGHNFELSREVAKYLTGKLNGKPFDKESFSMVMGNTRLMKMLQKYPIDKAAQKAAEMILVISGAELKEEKIKKLKSVINEIKK